jgi:hypothetical protein
MSLMKMNYSRRAIRHYVWRHSPVDHFMEPQLPDDPGPVHAVLFEPPKPNERRNPTVKSPAEQTDIHFIEFGDLPEAACGVRVRVVDVEAFDTDDAGVCPRCSEVAIIRQEDPAEYRYLLELRQKRRWEHQEARRDLEEYYESLEVDESSRDEEDRRLRQYEAG